MAARTYELRHTVGFEETNLVGNVYFTNHLHWQGRCREMFLRDHCPDLVDDLAGDLALVTLRCGCEYLNELEAFDEVVVRMRLVEQTANRITLGFDYIRLSSNNGGPPKETPIARGEQQIACMRRNGHGLEACPVPASLAKALEQYR